MIVCHCAVVSDRDIAAAAGTGNTLAEVCRATGAGQGCGGCVRAVRELLCRCDASLECPCTRILARSQAAGRAAATARTRPDATPRPADRPRPGRVDAA